MGIRKLSVILENVCQNKGVRKHNTLTEFLTAEKNRLYYEEINNKQMIRGLGKFYLKKNINSAPYVIGIDANLYAVRYKRIFRKIEYGIMKQIMTSLSYGIVPIYVFDGGVPEQKAETITHRKNQNYKNRLRLKELIMSNNEYTTNEIGEFNIDEIIENINSFHKENRTNKSNYLLYDSNEIKNISDEMIKLVKKNRIVRRNDIESVKAFLDLIKIPYVTSNGEADDMMSFLYNKKIIHACLSEDMDMLPKGCGNLIKITRNGIIQYCLRNILEELQLTQNQFIDLCILLGSDYYTTYLPKMKPMELYSTFRMVKNPSIESFVETFSLIDSDIVDHLESYKSVRKMFDLSYETISGTYSNIEEFTGSEFHKSEYNLVPIPFDTVIQYFLDYGIEFSIHDHYKIKSLVSRSNKFILSRNNSRKYQ